MELERICQNCCYYFFDQDDCDVEICSLDEAFEPFMDDVCKNEGFSGCYDLFLEKRFDGSKNACDKYEEIEIIDDTEYDYQDDIRLIADSYYQDVDKIIEHLYDKDIDIVKKAVLLISKYLMMGVEGAYDGLIEYYMSLGPAESLDDVHSRIKIVETLYTYTSDPKTIKAMINEIERTPSNNTTRRLLTKILRCLSMYPRESVQDLIWELLDRKHFSCRLRKRLEEIIGIY